MCGIVGIAAANAEDYRKNIDSMVRSIKHRGPDGDGTHFFKDCGLGHVRLSIIDPELGHQPMVSGSLAITFNGEIYGYKQIRKGLKGHRFKTTSDTEVILALYERDGPEMLERLPGMFSFAIWDESEHELFCARDRFGEKPFYYAMGPNKEFIFASEIKAVLASGLVKPELDLASLRHYLKYLYVHPARTIFTNVFTLPPAHWLRFGKGRVRTGRYWDLPEGTADIDLDSAVKEFRTLFESAVRKQLVADVTVGAFLSGGLDSSSIVAAASRFHDNLRTFSFGFEDNVSELPYAKGMSELCGTDHQELTARDVDIAKLLIRMNDIYDEPFADSSNIPTFLISELARKHVKVVISGDGGDELLGGYNWWYYPLFYMDRYGDNSFVKDLFIKLVAGFLARLDYHKYARWRFRADGLRLRDRYKKVLEAYTDKVIVLTDRQIDDISKVTMDPREADICWDPDGTLNDALRYDVTNYMPGDILVKTDRASMANGLELRAPFLDVDLASFCISAPASLKVTRENDKYLLRAAYQNAWTQGIRKRGKQGFAAPVEKWLGRKSTARLVEEYLNDRKKKIFGLLSYKKTREMVGKMNYQTWILLVLSIWLEKRDVTW